MKRTRVNPNTYCIQNHLRKFHKFYFLITLKDNYFCTSHKTTFFKSKNRKKLTSCLLFFQAIFFNENNVLVKTSMVKQKNRCTIHLCIMYRRGANIYRAYRKRRWLLHFDASVDKVLEDVFDEDELASDVFVDAADYHWLVQLLSTAIPF